MTRALALHAVHPARVRLFQTWLTLCAAVLAATLLHAGAHATGWTSASLGKAAAPMVKAVNARLAPRPAAVKTVLVWHGADVDGDGEADFANPTGAAPRAHDAYGEGRFGASRDGGVRDHEGVDYAANAGQKVVAPISGFVTKIGQAYADHPDLRFVEITNPALGHVARIFYVDPTVEVGQTVRLGDPIGQAHSLQAAYPGGMTDHVHLEIMGPDQRRFDAAQVIVARYRTTRAG